MNPQDNPQNQPPQSTPSNDPVQSPIQPSTETPVAPQPEVKPPAADPAAVNPFAQSTTPAGPAEPTVGGTPVIADKKPFPKKLVIILAAVLGGLGILALVVWLLLPMITGGSGPLGSSPLTGSGRTESLKIYDDASFSVKIPKDFVQRNQAASANVWTFSEDTEDRVRSSVLVAREDYSGVEKDRMIAQVKATYSEESFKSFANASGGQSMENYQSTDTTVDGKPAYKVQYDATRSDGTKAHVASVFVFDETEYFTVTITALERSTALKASINEIFESLKIK